jgi:hypothetical protein
MGAFFHNHLMRHILHPGGGHQKTHAVADIVEVGLLVHFQGNLFSRVKNAFQIRFLKQTGKEGLFQGF